jgi:PIN domain nuclease of toxin-antitoxin system
MRAILDTHTFLWWNTDDPQLSGVARRFISDGENELFLSAASTWEIAIKCARGRLLLPENPGEYVANRMAYYRIQPLPIQISHTLRIYELPDIHQDPFDRLLIAQSQMEDIPILTADKTISRYDVMIIW